MKTKKIMTYDFNHCKLCAGKKATATFSVGKAMIYVCPDCDFHFLNSLDSDSEEEQPLSPSAYHYIEARTDESDCLHPARLQLLASHIEPEAKILDVGAGIGQFQLLATAHNFDCLGLEPSSLRRQYAFEKSGLVIKAQTIEHAYWQSGYQNHFDAITLWDVIEHVNFPRPTLESAIKLLKPGGILFLDTPAREVLPYRLSQKICRLSGGKISLFLSSFYSTAAYGHKQIFTSKQLISLLQELGLKITCQQKSYASPTKGNKIIVAASK